MSITKHTFRVEGMHCGSCALLIDDALEDLPGVHSVQTSVKQGISTVELDTGTTGLDDVIGAIEDLGYQASTV